MLCGVSILALAQHSTSSPTGTDSSQIGFPIAPASQANLPNAPGNASAYGFASVSGVVQDASGAAVSGAHVVLKHPDGSQQSSLMTGEDGGFTFTKIPAGSYLVGIDAAGLAHYQSGTIALTAQEAYVMPPILLPVAAANAQVVVRPTEIIANQQVKAEEKQRIIGVFPNFYTSYIYDAAPLDAKQKYSLAFHEAFDPVSFIFAGVVAGVDQANNSFSGYGRGAAGYGKRYGAVYGTGLIEGYLSHAIFPSLLHQDPRYFYQGSGTTRSRIAHALSYPFVLRGDNGRPTPNYSFLLGNLGAGGLSNLYYPSADRGASLVFINAAVGLGGEAVGALFREFISIHLSTNVPGNGKP